MPSRTFQSLFHSKTLNQALKHFPFLSDLQDRHSIILKGLELLEKGTLEAMSEVSLHGQFLTEVFQQVLGYAPVTGREVWEIYAEKSMSDGGGLSGAEKS